MAAHDRPDERPDHARARQLAHRLADAGWMVIPVGRPDNPKRPTIGQWQQLATCDPDQVDALWDTRPGPAVGITTGGMVVVDLDPVDGRPNPWPEDEQLRAELESTDAIVLTPRGGRHHYFRCPTGMRLRPGAGKVAPGVDVRAGVGAQVLAAGSPGANGGGYRWRDQEYVGGPTDLPTLPPRLAALLEQHHGERPNANANGAHAVQRTVHEAGAKVAEGGRNAALTSRAGLLRNAGLSGPAMLKALQAVNLALCTPPLDDREVETIARSAEGFEAHPPRVTAPTPADGPAPIGWASPGEFPDHLLDVPGILGEFAEYAMTVSPVPQPAFAMAGAVSLLSTLVARRCIANRHLGMATISVLVGPTGSGKTTAGRLVQNALRDAGCSHRIGAGVFGSPQGMRDALDDRPAMLAYDDEGQTMVGMLEAKPGSSLAQCKSLIMTASTNQTSMVPEYRTAQTSRPPIYWPGFVGLATTQPDRLYEVMRSHDVATGMVSRLLIWEAFEGGVPDRRRMGQGDPSQWSLIVHLASEWRGSEGDRFNRNEPLTVRGDAGGYEPFVEVCGCDAGADRMLHDAAKVFHVRHRDTGARGELWARAAERVEQLAGLYACSRTPAEPVIDADAVTWAREVVEHQIGCVLFQSRMRSGDSRYELLANKVRRFLLSVGGRADAAKIRRGIQEAAKDRDAVLRQLVEDGLLGTDGRPEKVADYWLL